LKKKDLNTKELKNEIEKLSNKIVDLLATQTKIAEAFTVETPDGEIRSTNSYAEREIARIGDSIDDYQKELDKLKFMEWVKENNIKLF